MPLLTLLCACGQTGSPDDSTQQGQSPGKSRQPNTFTRKDVIVSELIGEDGVGSDSQGTEYQYSYHVPQIDDDTPDAAAINEELAALYGELAEGSLKNVKAKEIPGCSMITYESYRSGDVLCLVMKCAYYYGPFEEFGAYSYDTAKGVRLTNADILERKGVTRERYLYAVRCAAAKCYDDQYFPIWEDFGFDMLSGDYQERRSWTLSARDITPDMPLYLDNDGVLHTIAAIGCHTGADWLYHTLTLDLEDDTADVETEQSLGFLTVTRRGRAVTIRFNKTPGSAAILETDSYIDDVPYGKELPVNGLYGDYTRVFCGMAALCVFADTGGRVEYVDVMTCLRYGYFCAGGSLLGAEDVKDFSSDSDENGLRWVYAMTGSGERIELHDLIEADQLSMAGCFTGGWSRSRTVSMDGGGSYEEYDLLELTGRGDFDLTPYRFDQDESMGFNGYLIYLGMTEKSTVYAYRSWGITATDPVSQV